MKRLVGVVLLLWLASFLAVHSVVAEPDGKNKTDPPPLGFANEFPPGTFGGPAVTPEEALVVTAEFKIKKGSRDGTLAVTAKPAPGWYTYSMTQPDGGGLPSIVTVSKSADFFVDATKFQASRAPTIVKDPNFKVPQEKHKKPVTWTAPLRLSDGLAPESLRIQLTYSGQVCEENGKCIPIFDRKLAASFAGYVEPVRAAGPEFKAPRTHVTIQGHVEPKAASPGDVVKFVLTATPDHGYHIYPYAETDPIGGFKPTLIALDAGGWSASKPVTSDKTVTKDDLTYHEGPTTWTVQLQVPKDAKPGEQTIKGWLGYQGCTESTCDLPSGAAFTVTVGVAEKTAAGTIGISFSPASYTAAAKAAEEAAKPKPEPNKSTQATKSTPTGEFRVNKRSHVLIKGRVEPKVASPGGKVKLILTAVPDAPYHIYTLAKLAPVKSVSQPTLITITESPDWTRSEPVASTAVTNDPKGLAYYKGEVEWTIEFDVPGNAKSDDYSISGIIGFQVCIKDGSCDAPAAGKFSVRVPVSETRASGEIPLAFQAASYTSAAVAAAETEEGGGGASTSLAVVLVTLLAAFAAGMILNVMPCVLPVISLKIMSFVNQAGESRGRILSLNMWFSLGLLTVFWALAAVTVLIKVLTGDTFGWGSQFSHPSFVIPLIAILFVFALSFLGVWEIPIPGFVGSQKVGHLAEREGAGGAFAKGILATVLATPCTGPLLGPAIGWAIAQPPWLTFLAFTVVGLGMAAPYLAIGAMPKLINWLPRPGAWMETFKKAMGFVLILALVWLLWVLRSADTAIAVGGLKEAAIETNQTYVLTEAGLNSLSVGLFQIKTVLFLVALGFSCWIIGSIPLTAERLEKLRGWGLACAISALAGIAIFARGDWVIPVVSLITGGGLAIWLIVRTPRTAGMARKVGAWGTAAVLSFLAVVVTVFAIRHAELNWIPFSRAKLDEQLANGRTVMVDFTADW